MSEQLSTSAFRTFGKHPSQPDFVHCGPRTDALSSYDDWLTQSVEWAHARGGDAWRAAFRAGTVRAFLHRVGAPGRSAAFIAGAIAPSQDQAGRLFPISVSMLVQLGLELERSPQLLPLLCEEIWQSAGQCAAALSLTPTADVAAHLAALPPAESPSFVDAEHSYAGWGDQLPLLELWALIAPGQPREALGDAIRLLLEAVRPHRGESADTFLSLRLPLGAAGGAAVCFWLDAVRRLIGWQRTVPSFYWSHDGTEGQLTVHLGSAPPATISELWLPTSSRDEFCSLGLPIPESTLEMLPALPPASAQALREPTSVSAFLASLSG
ncbi:MAG TPA: type VI secretion system-associated protein TagF [Polyangiaceae bacterium]|nr:type VI secretion system-associated protein TagF [Polyangiaceae bacterium]